MIFNLIKIGLILFFNKGNSVYGISCKDENGLDVGWSLVHKPPNGYMIPNLGYLHKSEGETHAKWNFKKLDITAENMRSDDVSQLSIIGKILNPVYRKPNSYRYILYNNKMPRGLRAQTLSPKISSKFGSGKGALIWDNENAIFIIHSAQKFPPPFSETDSFTPINRDDYSNGHSFLCVNVGLSSIKSLMKSLMIAKVKVYDMNLNDDWMKLREAQLEIYEETNIPIPSTTDLHHSPRSTISRTSSHHSSRSDISRVSSISSPRSLRPGIFRSDSINSHHSSISDISRVSSFNSQHSLRPEISRSGSFNSHHSSRSDISGVSSISSQHSKKETPKIKKNSIDTISITTPKGTQLKVITKSFREKETIWQKVKRSLKKTSDFYFKSKSYSPNPLRSSKGLEITQILIQGNKHAVGISGRLHWGHESDESNIGYSAIVPYSYCQGDSLSNLRSDAGIAICITNVFDFIKNIDETMRKRGQTYF